MTAMVSVNRTDEAIILAGGFGTRLRSVVSDVPKPLAPVGGRPFLSWVLDALATQGTRRAILATGFMGDCVADVCGDSWHGMQLVYSRESEPLGTGGAIALAFSLVRGDNCLVLNGDTWLTLDWRDFDQAWQTSDARLAIALAEVADVSRYGAVRVERERVVGLVEKGHAGAGYINAGVYGIRRSLLQDLPALHNFSFENEVLMPTVKREAVFGYTRTRDFIDIGVPQDYQRAQQLVPTASRPIR
jgi:D-glycero-alpha-D-manno-heptose 1-phosphate guanylyltransferase